VERVAFKITEDTMGISNTGPIEISVENFGPIAEGKIELRQLTVFVGPSNTGKSYMAALIYALHRSFGASPESTDRSHFSKEIFRSRLNSYLETSRLSRDDVVQIEEWLKETVTHSEASIGPSPTLLQLQNSVSEKVRSILEDCDYLVQNLGDELSRCFGVEVTNRLDS